MGSRAAIIEAALAATRNGTWETTSLQAVREHAGVSNGTLFHHFPTRQSLATAVVAAGLADHQQALLEVLHAADEPITGVKQAVMRHLQWVVDNPHLARLLLSVPPEVLRDGLDAAALASNRTFFTEVADWLRGHGWPGTPELPLMVALWIGPAQDYARGWLAAPHQPPLPAGTVLAAGAWNALRPLLGKETS